jgi:hypothetical protein
MKLEEFQRPEILVVFNNNVLTQENRGRGVYHYISFNATDGMFYDYLLNKIRDRDVHKKLLYKDVVTHEDATPL